MHFSNVLKAIIRRWRIQVVDNAFDRASWWLGARQLLQGEAHILIRPISTSDVARRAGSEEEALASHQLLLCHRCGFALAVHWDGHILDVGVRRRAANHQDEAQSGSRKKPRYSAPD